MRAGFQHYGTLLADGHKNRHRFQAPLTMPALVLNGDHGLPQAPSLAGVAQIATTVAADFVPQSGHTFALDNPAWVAERLRRFFQ
jgi:pimeloyl-ACP methyl ester carboxylesterase